MWKKRAGWKLVKLVSRVLIRYGLLEFVTKALYYVSPQKRVREGRTQNEGDERRKKDGEQEYGQTGVSSVNWGRKGSLKKFACHI